MKKATITFGVIHLIGSILLTIGSLLNLTSLLNIINGPKPVPDNSVPGAFGLVYLAMTMGLVIFVTIMVLLSLYTIANLLFFIRFIKGKRIQAILVINIVVGLLFFSRAYDLIKLTRNEENLIYLYFIITGIIRAISGITYSLLVLNLNRKKSIKIPF